MYFDEIDANEWVLKDAFERYYASNNGDLAKALDQLKKDLETFAIRPNLLSYSKLKANNLLKDWQKTKRKLQSYSATEKGGKAKELPETTATIINNITTNDNASSSQTFNTIFTDNTNSTIPAGVKAGRKRKGETKEPYFFNSVEFSAYQTGEKDWTVSNINIGKSFQNYQIYVAEEFRTKEIHVESDTHEILALSNILLIKHGQNSRIFNNISNKKVVTYFDITKDIKNNLEKVIKGVLRDETTTKQAAKKITALTSDDPESTPDDMLLLGVRNLTESIPKVKTKEIIRESNLSCAYINSVLNPIFTSPDNNRLLVWSNIQVLPGNTMQPDFVVNKLLRSYYNGPCVIGDVKGEDRKDDNHDCLVDLIRIGMLSGDSINKNRYDGAVGAHIVGLQITFYITTLMSDGLYVMPEICSITLPRDFTEMRSYVATMEDLFPVIHYYHRCTTCSDEEWLNNNKKEMLEESTFLNMINSGKSKKGNATLSLAINFIFYLILYIF